MNNQQGPILEQPANPDLGYQFTPTPSGGYWSNSQGDHWTYNQDNAQWTNEHTGDKWQVNGDGSSTHISGPQPDNKPPEKSGPTPTGDDLGDGSKSSLVNSTQIRYCRGTPCSALHSNTASEVRVDTTPWEATWIPTTASIRGCYGGSLAVVGALSDIDRTTVDRTMRSVVARTLDRC